MTIRFNKWALIFLLFPCANLSAEDSGFRNTGTQVRFVGSQVCASCHAGIFATYAKTAMGRSMALGNSATGNALPVPFTVFDSDSGEYFEVSRKDGDYYQSVYAVDHAGKEMLRQAWKLPFVIGAGENGFGLLLQRDGYLFEGPLTYYTKSQVWSFSPGYERRNLAFTRPVIAECVGCHSARPRPIYEKAALYRNPPFEELAIGCENCHGPGALHVAERRAGLAPPGGKDTSIVNPARLTETLADNICMKCHQGGDVRVMQPGRHMEDFRPGTRLDDVVAIFKAPLSKDAASQSVLLEHYYSMTLSRCYRGSSGRLRCTSCHDPHKEPSAEEAGSFYRAKCLSCHAASNCKLALADRTKTSPADACASCHMPKRTVTTITHAALTEHRVIAKPDEPYPSEAFAPAADQGTGLFHLTAGDVRAEKIPPLTLFQAYAGLIRDGHTEFSERANAMLDQLARASPRNPVVLSALARRAMNRQGPEAVDEAIGYFTAAIQDGSPAAEDFLLLAGLYGRKKQNAESISILRRGMAANPYVREFPESLAAQHMSSGEYRDASAVIRKGLEIFPDDVALRALQKKIQDATLDGSPGP